MEWIPFHHPDISLPVIRRHASDVLADLLVDYAEIAMTRGRSLFVPSMFPSETARRSALSRLKKQGLVVHDGGSNGPELSLTGRVLENRPAALSPKAFWRQKWTGIWYQIVYDVPEKERAYRQVLRKFLCTMRMGRLQNSVYVTPRDIRPEFADLVSAAGAGAYAHLFEARTVLGQSVQTIVSAAWDFDTLDSLQSLYLRVYGENLRSLKGADCSRDELVELANHELVAYLQVMSGDPLLPRRLHPAGYLGEAVYALHCEFAKTVCGRAAGT